MTGNDRTPVDTVGCDRRQLFGGAAIFALGGIATTLPGNANAQTRMPAGSTRPAASTRRLGSLEVSPIGLGCMSMVAGTYNPAPDRKDMVALIRAAVDRGVTFLDTAEVYGPYTSEEIVGEALQPVRDRVVLASKVGFNIENGKSAGQNGRPEHIRQAVEGMLRRLRIDRIDLLYLHRVDAAVPIEDSVGAFTDLIRAGKIREYGLSEVAPDTIRRAHKVHPVAALQNEYSLIERLPEVAAIGVCQELGIGFVPWSPIGRALLTDGFNEYSRFAKEDRRATVPQFAPDALVANMAVVRLVRRWADRKGVTPVQFALAWLLTERPFMVPIPGTTKLAHLDENLGALNVVILPDELRQFRAELSAITVVGNRPREQAFRDMHK